MVALITSGDNMPLIHKLLVVPFNVDPKLSKFWILLGLVYPCLLIINYQDLETVVGLGVPGKDGRKALFDHVDCGVPVALGVPFSGDNMPANVLRESGHKFIVLEVSTVEVNVAEVPLAVPHASYNSREVEGVNFVSSLVAELR